MSEPRWGVGSNQYKKRPGRPLQPGPPEPATDMLKARTPAAAEQVENFGFSWDSSAVRWDLMEPMEVPRALARFSGRLAEHVWAAAALEGNPYTLPEVQTLLEGVTVGGHKLEDEKQILALSESTRMVHDLVRDGQFAADKSISDRLHGVVAPHEAIEAGHFRGEGQVGGGGLVGLGEYGSFQATGCENGGAELRSEYRRGVAHLQSLEDPAEQAVAYFCMGARRQFYFDGNKRTSRLMMNGILLSSGRDAISIPFSRRLEFNQHLISLYRDADATGLMEFIVDCRPQD